MGCEKQSIYVLVIEMYDFINTGTYNYWNIPVFLKLYISINYLNALQVGSVESVQVWIITLLYIYIYIELVL